MELYLKSILSHQANKKSLFGTNLLLPTYFVLIPFDSNYYCVIFGRRKTHALLN